MKNSDALIDPQLQAFIAVAKHKSMHAAAKAIYVTQTTVTQRIRSLEDRLNTTLFIRNRQGVIITEPGLALLEYCSKTQQLAGETLAKLNGSASNVRLSITGSSSYIESYITPILKTLIEKNPQLLCTVHADDSKNRILALQNGIYDFAILEPTEVLKEMSTKQLASEKYILVGKYEWSHRRLPDIFHSERVIDFDPHDSMTLNYLRHHNLATECLSDRHFANTNFSLIPLLINGLGYGVLTEKIAKPYLEQKQLCVLNEGKTYSNPLVLAWYERTNPHVFFNQFISLLS